MEYWIFAGITGIYNVYHTLYKLLSLVLKANNLYFNSSSCFSSQIILRTRHGYIFFGYKDTWIRISTVIWIYPTVSWGAASQSYLRSVEQTRVRSHIRSPTFAPPPSSPTRTYKELVKISVYAYVPDKFLQAQYNMHKIKWLSTKPKKRQKDDLIIGSTCAGNH